MARYVWVIFALCPRDGGWVRMAPFGREYWPSLPVALLVMQEFWPMMVMAGDYAGWHVVKTIAF